MLTDRTVVLHGSRFHYTERGDRGAPPVILLHGVTGHARTWDEEGAALVGLSLGGRVAIQYAGTQPTRVTRLVVVDIGPDIAPEGFARVGRMMAGAPERFDTLEDVIAFQRANNPRYTEVLLQARVRHGVRPLPDGGFTWKYDRGLREAVRAGRFSAPIDLWPPWRALACPTLLVRGAESDILTADIAKKMLEAQPNARLAEVAGAGHTVPGDQPAVFVTLLADFLDA